MQHDPSPHDDESLGQLLAELGQDLSTLVRDEIALAKVEISESVTKAGIGAGLFGAAGVIALYGIGALIATLVLLLALVIDAWLAALIVTLVLFAAAGGAAALGKREITQATPPLEQTPANVQQDLDALKGGTP